MSIIKVFGKLKELYNLWLPSQVANGEWKIIKQWMYLMLEFRIDFIDSWPLSDLHNYTKHFK